MTPPGTGSDSNSRFNIVSAAVGVGVVGEERHDVSFWVWRAPFVSMVFAEKTAMLAYWSPVGWR
jgi:hypothetical protein